MRGRDAGFVLVASAVFVALLAAFVARDERRVCAAPCDGLPTTYGDALYWLVSRLLGGDPDGLGPTSAGNRFIGVLMTIYGVFILVAIVGNVFKHRMEEDSRTGAEVVAGFEARRAAAATTGLYPPIEPSAHDMLEVGDGHRIYWEVCGNPAGKPALVLHGGPGSGCTRTARRYFDPDAYRIVLFDQRGSGRSTPHAGEPTADLSANTTDHLVADIERLRPHLGVDRWLVLGGSWGSTLALRYAQRHPEAVTELVLTAVTVTSRGDVEWITRRMARLLPARWARFRDGVPPAERDGDLVEAYYRLLTHPDPAVHGPAARNWCDWETEHMSVLGPRIADLSDADARFQLGFARLVTHYWRQAGWLADGELLGHVDRLAGIPGVLIHGRRDVSCPPDTAWLLTRSWPDATLVLVDDAGHGGGGIPAEIVRATDRFRFS